MSHAKFKRSQRLDPRGPLVFETRTLGSASARSETRTVPAPAELGSGLVHVPEGSDIALEVRLEEVSEGVLVTAELTAPLAGECARCLDEFTSSTQVRFQELFAAEPGGSGDDGYLLDGDLLDLEPALRDALVLDLPLSPLCSADCPGLCSYCGVRLADAEAGHRHADDGGVWAVLKDLFPEAMADAGEADANGAAARTAKPTAANDGNAKEQVAGTGAESAKAGPISPDRRQGRASLTGTTGPARSKEH